MQLPIPPSDSLYKFVCIGSLLGTISLVIWTDRQVTDLKNRAGEQRRRQLIAGAELEGIKDEVAYLRTRIAQAEAKEGTAPSLAEVNKLNASLHAQRLKYAEIAADKEAIARLSMAVQDGTRLGLFQIACFALLFLGCLYLWYTKVQSHQDRMLRAQVETAELALKKAWAEEQASRAAQTGAAPEG